MVRARRRVGALTAGAALVLAGCGVEEEGGSEGGETTSETSRAGDQQYPDVEEAELAEADGEGYTVSVTISSPYDTPERYADGWRVLGPDEEVLAEHELGHDHADEQPFTRDSDPFAIPADVDEVTVEGRDLEHGYGGDTVSVEVPD